MARSKPLLVPVEAYLLTEAVKEKYKYTLTGLRAVKKKKKGTPMSTVRIAWTYLLFVKTNLTQQEVAWFVNRDHTTVSIHFHAHQDYLKRKKGYRQAIDYLDTELILLKAKPMEETLSCEEVVVKKYIYDGENKLDTFFS